MTDEERAQKLANLVNSMGMDYEKTAEALGREHRTLQQNFTRFCIYWLLYLSKVERTDMRNEASVWLAKEIHEKTPLDKVFLPYV
jgi:hypothetical protein